MRRILILVPTLALLLSACAGMPTEKRDNSALLAAAPHSILVLPPTNESVAVQAPYTFLSTISQPLAERGYYVFPVAVVDDFLKNNGLPTPAEMNAIPLDKIRQYIDADAVLYTNIKDWGQKFQLFASVTVVQAHLRLVDSRTGNLLWEADAAAQRSSNDSGNGGGILGAIVTQVMAKTMADPTPELARQANTAALGSLLPGPYAAVPETRVTESDRQQASSTAPL